MFTSVILQQSRNNLGELGRVVTFLFTPGETEPQTDRIRLGLR